MPVIVVLDTPTTFLPLPFSSASPLHRGSPWVPTDLDLRWAAKANDTYFLERYPDTVSTDDWTLDFIDEMIFFLRYRPEHPFWDACRQTIEDRFPFTLSNVKGRWTTTKGKTVHDWFGLINEGLSLGYTGLLALGLNRQRMIYPREIRDLLRFGPDPLSIVCQYGKFVYISDDEANIIMQEIAMYKSEEEADLFLSILGEKDKRFAI